MAKIATLARASCMQTEYKWMLSNVILKIKDHVYGNWKCKVLKPI